MDENLLKLVKNPAQYINSEWNSETSNIIRKKSRNDVVKICLCFPDKYTIGMSNLGIEILYKLLNSYDDIICERVFAIDTDFENILRKEDITLFSLETKEDLKNFDIIGFSLQSELNYTNIFTILHLAKIQFKSKERKNLFPLIIAGGPCSCNPYVLKNYFDFFVLGEAEECFIKIIEIVKKYKNQFLKNPNLNQQELKNELLKEINLLKETYVPSYENKLIIPATVDIKNSFYPENLTVPIIRTTHNRINIELTRGCGYNCNFCQAGYICKPLRYRDKNKVLELIEKNVSSTGYDEIALTGYCVTNYPYLLEVIDFVNKKFANQYVSISLPSLRIEDINENLISNLGYIRKSTITLAPETATEKLRKVINKNITNKEIFQKISILYKYGFNKIKLYFMVGLPTETETDIENIPKLVKEIKKYINANFNITVSPFIPKPHTPLQFAKMDNFENLYKKILFLKKQLNKMIHIKNIEKHIYSSIIEALISRGDEKIGELIEEVWYEGARFDSWDENFNPSLWLKKIKQLNIDLNYYLHTEKDKNFNFVWDNIKYFTTKEKLYEKYILAKNITYDIEENLNFENIIISEVNNKNQKQSIQQNQTKKENFINTVRLRFERKNKLKFLSYFDQMEIIKRTLRMANLPLSYSCGFNPQIKMSFSPPISVGYESKSEYIDLELYKKVSNEEIINKIKKFLPEGLDLVDTKIFDLPLNKIVALNSCVNLVEYIITSDESFNEELLEEFKKKNNFVVEKYDDKNNKIKKINISELIKEIKLLEKNKLYLLQRLIPKKNLKPEFVIGKIFSIPQQKLYKLNITRENLYIETKTANIISLI
ncbi:MAG: TIGR03960 family B12-binding radical SAM protein [Endomicrobiia bacterium]